MTMTTSVRTICRSLYRAPRVRLCVVMLSLGFVIVSVGCNKSMNDSAAEPTTAVDGGGGSAGGDAGGDAAGAGGGFTVTLQGFTLNFSDEWQQSPPIPGNPAVGVMLGRTPQEAMENGATLVVMAREVPKWSDAAKSMNGLRKQPDSQFMKTEQDKDIQIGGMSGFFQLVRSFGNPKASTDALREDTLQHKWTLSAGNQILLITGQCRASKAAEFAPKFEEVVQTLKVQ